MVKDSLPVRHVGHTVAVLEKAKVPDFVFCDAAYVHRRAVSSPHMHILCCVMARVRDRKRKNMSAGRFDRCGCSVGEGGDRTREATL